MSQTKSANVRERQKIYMRNKRAALRIQGLCTHGSCSEKQTEGSTAYCLRHLVQRREKQQERNGHRPWQPGSPGKQPIGAA